jgi:nitrate/nitrite transporter NarK
MAWTVLTVGQFAAVIAMLQRSSLGVATTDASARFGITAATLAAFSMVQLLVYAVLQVPVGVLIDQYGSKRLIVVGSLIMAGAQTMFAVATTLLGDRTAVAGPRPDLAARGAGAGRAGPHYHCGDDLRHAARPTPHGGWAARSV